MLPEPSTKKELSLIYSLLRTDSDDSISADQKNAMANDVNSKLLDEFGISMDTYSFQLIIPRNNLTSYFKTKDSDFQFLDHGSAEQEVCRMIEDGFSNSGATEKEKKSLNAEESCIVVSDNVTVRVVMPATMSMVSHFVESLKAMEANISEGIGASSELSVRNHGLDSSVQTFSNMVNSSDFDQLVRKDRQKIRFNDSESANAFTREVLLSSKSSDEINQSMFIDKHSGLENVFQNYKGKLSKTIRANESTYSM